MKNQFIYLVIYLIIFFGASASWAEVIDQPQKQVLQTELELAKQFTVKGSALNSFRDLSLFSEETKPALRVGSPKTSDLRHQTGVQIWINLNEIRPQTLVISDTGHDIAILYQLMKNEKFSVDHAFYFPNNYRENKEITKGSAQRILSQAQMYGAAIHKMSQAETRPKNLYFLGLDAHRNDNRMVKLPIAKMPTVEDLKRLNIAKVVILLETNPAFSRSRRLVSKDMTSYLETIETSVDVVVEGVDCRSYQDFGGHAFYGRLPDGCTGEVFSEIISQ